MQSGNVIGLFASYRCCLADIDSVHPSLQRQFIARFGNGGQIGQG